MQQFQDVSAFASFVYENDGKEIDLYVYNSTQEQIRAVRITPKSEWGGKGLLGCDVMHGAIHGIPSRKQNLWGEKAKNKDFVRAKGAFNLEELEKQNYETTLTQEDMDQDQELKPLSSGSDVASNSSSHSYDTQVKNKELQLRKMATDEEEVEDVTCDEIQLDMEAKGENLTVLPSVS